MLRGEICGDVTELEQETRAGNGPDLPPEYCRYRDEGCQYARACLDCPFPQCFYDAPRGRQRWLKELRNREINRLFEAGCRVGELASLFNISDRTVNRALKNNK